MVNLGLRKLCALSDFKRHLRDKVPCSNALHYQLVHASVVGGSTRPFLGVNTALVSVEYI